jgi:hypothetical protein
LSIRPSAPVLIATRDSLPQAHLAANKSQLSANEAELDSVASTWDGESRPRPGKNPMTSETLYRDIRAILGFLLKAEVDAIFKQQPFELKDENTDPARSWRVSCDTVRSLSPTPTNAQIGLLDENQLSIIKQIKARRTFAKYYEAVDDYQFALVPVNALLASQWFADLDYINELASHVSENASLEDLIRFTMAEGVIAQPIISGPQVLFASQRPDIHADPIPVVREVEPGEFEIIVRANSRPNYVSVASIGGRLLLPNGVHHVCALYLRGFESVPCVLRNVGRIEEVGLDLRTSLFRPELLSGPRPAQVLDFLDDQVAVPLKLRSMYHTLRIGIGVEQIKIPAIQSPNFPSKHGVPQVFTNPSNFLSGAGDHPAPTI